MEMRTITVDGKNIEPCKILCVGKNYVAHIEEMGGSEMPDEPTIFMKPNTAIGPRSGEVTIPGEFGLLHHEVELCFTVSRTCRNISEDDAPEAICAWGVGIDFTLRDRQSIAKNAGGPWTISKCFDGAAMFGEFTQPGEAYDPLNLSIQLSVNHEIRQSANTRLMIFTPIQVLCFVSRFMTVDPGDVFMLGTPKGVGEVLHGDLLEAEITGLPPLRFTVIRP